MLERKHLGLLKSLQISTFTFTGAQTISNPVPRQSPIVSPGDQGWIECSARLWTLSRKELLLKTKILTRVKIDTNLPPVVQSWGACNCIMYVCAVFCVRFSTCSLMIFNKPKKHHFFYLFSTLGRQSLIFSQTTFTCTGSLFTVSQEWNRGSVQVYMAGCSNTITLPVLFPFFYYKSTKNGRRHKLSLYKNHWTFADIANLFWFYSISGHSLF